jgi:hypothetical protein
MILPVILMGVCVRLSLFTIGLILLFLHKTKNKVAMVLFSVAALFIIVLISYLGLHAIQHTAASSTDGLPVRLPTGFGPNELLEENEIKLPVTAEIPSNVRREAAIFLLAAEKAKVDAFYFHDDRYLTDYFAEEALKSLQAEIERARQTAYVEVRELDLTDSYYPDMQLIDNKSVLLIHECAFEKSHFYESKSRRLISESPWHMVAREIRIDISGETAIITSISTYNDRAFCTRSPVLIADMPLAEQ